MWVAAFTIHLHYEHMYVTSILWGNGIEFSIWTWQLKQGGFIKHAPSVSKALFLLQIEHHIFPVFKNV